MRPRLALALALVAAGCGDPRIRACVQGDLLLGYDAEVAAADTTCVIGSVLVSVSGTSPPLALVLPKLTSVGGSLSIADDVLDPAHHWSFSAPALKSVTGDFGVTASSLDRLDIPALTFVGDSFFVRGESLRRCQVDRILDRLAQPPRSVQVTANGTPDRCCADGACADPNETCDADLCSCKTGFTWCDAQAGCFDLQNDPQACGQCGNVCPTPAIGCAGGACACPSGERLRYVLANGMSTTECVPCVGVGAADSNQICDDFHPNVCCYSCDNATYSCVR